VKTRGGGGEGGGGRITVILTVGSVVKDVSELHDGVCCISPEFGFVCRFVFTRLVYLSEWDYCRVAGHIDVSHHR